MGAVRQPGWEVTLAARLQSVVREPFVWGQHDCATWAFDVRRALIGGEDIAAIWRGKYKTAAGSRRTMKRLGWKDIGAMARDLLGEPLPTTLLAQRGDLMLAGDDPAFGVCAGAFGRFLGPDGAVDRPVAECLMAWRT